MHSHRHTEQLFSADFKDLYVWCRISPTRLLVCSLVSAGAGLLETGLPAAPEGQNELFSVVWPTKRSGGHIETTCLTKT